MDYEHLYFDIETDGLLESWSKVHCLAVHDGKEGHLFVGDDIPKGLALLDRAGVVVAHNGIAFDLLVLWGAYKWKPRAKIHDTLIMSCLFHPDIPGGHSLEAWGERLNFPKINYTEAYIEWRKQDASYKHVPDDEWTTYNPVMGEYCLQDVAILPRLYRKLLDDSANWDWGNALKMEHQFAKDFAIQARRGVYIDRPFAERLLADIESQMDEAAKLVEPLLPQRPCTKAELVQNRPPKRCFKKDGKPAAATLSWFDKVEELGGEWVGHKFGKQWHLPTATDEQGNRLPLKTTAPMTLKDQEALKTWLMSECGWRPTMWSYKKKPDKNGKLRIVRGDDGEPIPSQPKFHNKGELCPNLAEVASQFPHADLVVKWVVFRHRRGLVKSILEHVRENSRVPATGMSLGTPTSRVTHAVVANIPKADKDVPLGKECRQIFAAKPGTILVGVDASGLELRCLAHYANSKELVSLVLADKDKGELDIHTLLAQGYSKVVGGITRQAGKSITYALLYGASNKKVGQTAGAPDNKAERVGEACRDVFFGQLPGMDRLAANIERAAKAGHIKAIDGRRIPIRSKHATLNTLLQSCGSILVKWAQCYMNAELRKRQLRAWQVISYHDEVVLESHPDDAQQAGERFIAGLQWAASRFQLRCPLSGEVKVGRTWADVH